MSVTIYHNTACGTSRTTLQLIRDAGIEPVIIDYVKQPPTRAAVDRADRARRLDGARRHARQGRAVRRAGAGGCHVERRRAARRHAGPSDTDQPPVRGDGARRAPVPAGRQDQGDFAARMKNGAIGAVSTSCCRAAISDCGPRQTSTVAASIVYRRCRASRRWRRPRAGRRFPPACACKSSAPLLVTAARMASKCCSSPCSMQLRTSSRCSGVPFSIR